MSMYQFIRTIPCLEFFTIQLLQMCNPFIIELFACTALWNRMPWLERLVIFLVTTVLYTLYCLAEISIYSEWGPNFYIRNWTTAINNSDGNTNNELPRKTFFPCLIKDIASIWWSKSFSGTGWTGTTLLAQSLAIVSLSAMLYWSEKCLVIKIDDEYSIFHIFRFTVTLLIYY